MAPNTAVALPRDLKGLSKVPELLSSPEGDTWISLISCAKEKLAIKIKTAKKSILRGDSLFILPAILDLSFRYDCRHQIILHICGEVIIH
tara:strand:- start:18759 stop:19028 length:270 start_codon:yes stop_codon:yes gene_type:complete